MKDEFNAAKWAFKAGLVVGRFSKLKGDILKVFEAGGPPEERIVMLLNDAERGIALDMEEAP